MSLSAPSSQSMRRRPSNILGALSRSNTLSHSSLDDLETTPPHNITTSASEPAPSLPNVPAQSLALQLESLRNTVNKRILTLSYLKRTHQGHVNWFNTVAIQPQDIDALCSPDKVGKRTTAFALLSMSLSPLLETVYAHEFVKNLNARLQDYEAFNEDTTKNAKSRNLFKSYKAPKKPTSTSTGSEYASSLTDVSETYFFTQNIPFDLDYLETFYTLCDILTEIYRKIYVFSGGSLNDAPNYPMHATNTTTSTTTTNTTTTTLNRNSSSPSSSTTPPPSTTPPSTQSQQLHHQQQQQQQQQRLPHLPHSSSFTSYPSETNSFSSSSNKQQRHHQSLGLSYNLPSTPLDNSSSNAGFGSGFGSGQGASPSPTPTPNTPFMTSSTNLTMGSTVTATSSSATSVGVSPAMADLLSKIDGKLKKIISMITKEIDTLARSRIAEEIGSINLGLTLTTDMMSTSQIS